MECVVIGSEEVERVILLSQLVELRTRKLEYGHVANQSEVEKVSNNMLLVEDTSVNIETPH